MNLFGALSRFPDFYHSPVLSHASSIVPRPAALVFSFTKLRIKLSVNLFNIQVQRVRSVFKDFFWQEDISMLASLQRIFTDFKEIVVHSHKLLVVV